MNTRTYTKSELDRAAAIASRTGVSLDTLTAVYRADDSHGTQECNVLRRALQHGVAGAVRASLMMIGGAR
jgi:hypothetical protein